jgi:hypothetical protein
MNALPGNPLVNDIVELKLAARLENTWDLLSNIIGNGGEFYSKRNISANSGSHLFGCGVISYEVCTILSVVETSFPILIRIILWKRESQYWTD